LKSAVGHIDGAYLSHLLGLAFDDANNVTCKGGKVEKWMLWVLMPSALNIALAAVPRS